VTRITVSSWEELCRYIRDNKGVTIKLRPVSWLGERKVDRKTKQDTNEVGDDVLSIVFEVEKSP
jgi:hypothetical protein